MTRYLALSLLLLFPTPAAASGPEVAILGYHAVESNPTSGWAANTEDFTDQMRYLASAGYHVIPIATLYEYLSGTRDSLPADAVVITVDDGFLDAYTEIRPVMKRFAFPWSLYIYPRFIGAGKNALTWTQVRRLSDEGVDIQGHTMTHAHLMHRSHPEMSEADYAAWLHEQLAGSRIAIQEKTGKPVRFLAYPYGDYDKIVQAEAARSGYVVGLTSESGTNTRATNLLGLKRFAIISDTTIAQFINRGLGALPLSLTDLAPAADSAAAPKTVSAVIADAAQLDPSTIHITLLGEPVAGTFNAATGLVSVDARSLKRARQQVIVWGLRASDRRRMAGTWTFYTNPAAKKRYEDARKRLLELPLHHTDTKRK